MLNQKYQWFLEILQKRVSSTLEDHWEISGFIIFCEGINMCVMTPSLILIIEINLIKASGGFYPYYFVLYHLLWFCLSQNIKIRSLPWVEFYSRAGTIPNFLLSKQIAVTLT